MRFQQDSKNPQVKINSAKKRVEFVNSIETEEFDEGSKL